MPLPLVQKRSNFWYLLPLVFAIFGGVIAYFVLRKTDPSKARNCLLIGIGMVFVGIIYTVARLLSDLDPEIGERRIIEQQAIRDEYEQRTGEKIELVPAGSFDWESEKLKIEQDKLEQDRLRIEQYQTLPKVCDGVFSIESNLYPTGEECMELIDERIFEFCLSKNNGNEDMAWGCFGKTYALIDDNCIDSDEDLLSVSYEVCFMNQMRFLYENIPPTP